MKTLCILLLIVVGLSGCSSVIREPDKPITVVITNDPPTVHVTLTNSTTNPDSIEVKLNAESEKALISAIEAGPSQLSRPIIVTSTNVIPVQVQTTITNNPSFPEILKVGPDDETAKFLKSMVNDKWLKKDTLLSTLIGGLLAAFAGLLAAWKAHNLETTRKQAEEKEFNSNVLRSIRSELEATSAIYDLGMGTKLKQVSPGQYLTSRLSLTLDWMTVFTANASHLGRIPSPISLQIIKVHCLLKALIEEYRINNEYLMALGQIEDRLFTQPANSYLNQAKAHKTAQLIDEVTRLRQVEAILKTETNNFYSILDSKGVK
jgi:hypothetical protein